MAGPIKLTLNHVEMLNDNGIEWNMNFEEVLGGTGRGHIVIQDRTGGLWPQAHQDVEATIRSGPLAGWVLFRGELLTPSFTINPQDPWIRWDADLVDYNDELPQRKVGAFDGITWLDTSGLGVFVNIDPYGTTLQTDLLTVQQLFDHYVRVDGSAIDTSTYVNEYLTDIFPIEWAYSDVQRALTEMAALIVDNLQFWIDPDLKFHWVTIPAWQDLLQQGVAVSGDPTLSQSAMLFPEAILGLSVAPYEIVDASSNDVTTIGFSKLRMTFDGANMPEQVYVKGGTGYVYNAPPPTDDTTKTTVHNPTPGVADHYELTIINTTKLWHTDSTGYISTSYDLGSPGGPWTCKWVHVPWNEARHKGGYFWKLLEGPYSGKLVDDNTNTLSGYGKIKVQKVTLTPPTEPLIGVGGTGWTNEATQDPNKRQAYLEAPIATDQAKRDALGSRAEYQGQSPTLRGTVHVRGLDGWRVGQAVKITDIRLPSALSGQYYVIQKIKASVLEGNDIREYDIDFGDGPQSRYSMRPQPGDITWPPPFAYIEIKVFDLSPGPNSSQKIIGQLVAPDGTPWEISGKTVNWTLECYNSAGVKQTGQGTLDPEVSVTNRHGRAHTTFTSGSATGVVYYIFADVKAT